MEGLREFLGCLIAALGVSLLAAWPGMYLLWARELRGRSVFATPLQVLRWQTWLILLALVSFGTLYVLGYIVVLVKPT